MREVYKSLFVGDDADYEKVKNSPDWRILRACKDGPGGHRETLGYTERSAPKGPDYLFVERPRKLILNLVDSDDPGFYPDPLVAKALAYISDSVGVGQKILVSCNRAESRAPSLAFLWLVQNGKLPVNYNAAARQFQKIYPDYDPGDGIRLAVKKRIQVLRNKR